MPKENWLQVLKSGENITFEQRQPLNKDEDNIK